MICIGSCNKHGGRTWPLSKCDRPPKANCGGRQPSHHVWKEVGRVRWFCVTQARTSVDSCMQVNRWRWVDVHLVHTRASDGWLEIISLDGDMAWRFQGQTCLERSIFWVQMIRGQHEIRPHCTIGIKTWGCAGFCSKRMREPGLME